MSDLTLPMSSAQQGMYFDSHMRQAADYHITVELRTSHLDHTRLLQAVKAIMVEQPALRCAITTEATGPSYRIAESAEAPFSHYDLTNREEELDSILNSARNTPFDLETPPLFRIINCHLPDSDHLLIVCHHLIADGLSVSALTGRLLHLATGTDDILPTQTDNSLQIYQENQIIKPPAEETSRSQKFWEENLSRHEDPQLGHWLLQAGHDDIGRETRITVPLETAEAIRLTAREAEVSEFTIYLATFGTLLSHYAGEEQVSFASPFTDRPLLDMDESIGCFIRALPVMVDANRQQSVRMLLKRTRAEVLSIWKNLSFPVTTMLADHSITGLLDITFIHDSYPSFPEGVHVVKHPDQAHFPGRLTVTLEQVGETTEIVVRHKDSALSVEQATQFAERMLRLLQQIPNHLDAPVSELMATTEEEHHSILAASQTTHYYDWEPTDLGQLFLERTTADPAHETWLDPDRSYTNAWAHDAAVLIQHRILEAVGTNDRPVAILLPRSATLLAAVCGTILAGHPYIPLSDQMPLDRIHEMLTDADACAIVTISPQELQLPTSTQRIDLDTYDDLNILASSHRDTICESPLPVDRSPEDLLYIEYTSGSTGRPKGVGITHANVQNTALDLERRFPLRRDDVFLCKTSFTFDIFGTELYGWLVGEGRLAILPAGQEGDLPALLDAVHNYGVTHLNTSPTLLRVLLKAIDSTGRQNDLESLRHLFSGGEALSPDIIQHFFALGLACSLENVYGPTEATMWATHTQIHPEDCAGNAPIGTPLNDYRLYVLNPQGQLCGTDLPGELCIAGAGVGVGYLNQNELTAHHFIDNPFADTADAEHMHRMYRTGDLGFLRPDGRFSFLRRIDQQVKVAGIRVELGEIEQALLSIDGITEAAAIVDDSTGTPRLIGFYVSESTLPQDQIRQSLSSQLITQLIPAVLIQTNGMPTSAAGKLDRHALQALLEKKTKDMDIAETADVSPAIERLAKLWNDVLGSRVSDPHRTFFEAGGTSLSLMRLQIQMQQEFNIEISITDLLSHPTMASQSDLLSSLIDVPTTTDNQPISAQPTQSPTDDVAIIGIGLQVPGAEDINSFWDLLMSGQESITFYDDDELRALGVPESQLRDPSYVKASGYLEGIETFDDLLFRISPAEVDKTSPQLRLLYKCFWQACEDAGYDPQSLPGRVGVFAAGNDDFEWYQGKLISPESFGETYQNFTLATNHFLSTRLSYQFDLTGPSLSALSGCSSSLLTVHLAVQSLRSGECDLAVAGGVTAELRNAGGYQWFDGMMFSRDGHCRPFDAQANGTVFSNGGALLLLKPAAAAQRDGDPIYAIIKGSASGNDGRKKLSYTAPSEEGQYETISSAYHATGINPATVSFVEAHGTGTLLGDPIEVASLTRVFSDSPKGSCLLSSVKGNIGHTDSAAGAVGLSKAALSLKHRMLPGTVNFQNPNPHIDFKATPFEVTAEARPLEGDLIRAGINSFGVGGTNVHMILEEAPDIPQPKDPDHVLFQFSGVTSEAMSRTAERFIRHVAADSSVSLADAAVTLRSRTELPYRSTLVIAADEIRDADTWMGKLHHTDRTASQKPPRVALLFSGQGNQYHRMGHGLYASNSSVGQLFRGWMDDLIGMLPGKDAHDFHEVLYEGVDDGRIHRTEWSQFALFSTQFALAKVLESFGLVPDIMVGHSIGELTAAALAGVWPLEEAAILVRQRGLLMQSQPPGIMVAALAPAARVAEVISEVPDAWISLDNSPERSVVGMAPHAFDTVMSALEKADIIGARLHTSQAFHTPMMAEAGAAFTAAVGQTSSQDPKVPIISNRTGHIVQSGEMTDPRYWGDHITGAVRFTDSLTTLLADDYPLLAIETGPGQSLATFIAQVTTSQHDANTVSLLRHAAADISDEAQLLAGLGDVWRAGLPLDWTRHSTGHRRSLPGYSFDAHPHPVSRESAAIPVVCPKPAPAAAAPSNRTRLDVFCEAFRNVLGYENISPNDDFFVLGGDSLKATGLTAQLKALLGIEATVSDVFAAPTPASLAARLPEGAAAVSGMLKAPEMADHPLSPAQERMYLAWRLDPSSVTYNMSSVTWLDGRLDHDRVHTALMHLAERHDSLRTVFTLRDGEVRQQVTTIPASDLPLRFTRGRATPDTAETSLAQFTQPFNLATGPLFRMQIIEDDEASLLLFDLHHIIGDATSVEVMTRDFSKLYDGELTPLTHQYIDYVHHNRSISQDESTTAAERTLLEALANPPSADVLPLDHPRGELAPAAARTTWSLSPDRTARLKEFAEAHQATLSMVMLAAWGGVLARYTEAEDLVIGAPMTGRTLVETREMVGMFVNMMPIRLRPQADASFSDYLASTRQTMLDAIAAQDVPFDRIIEKLGVTRTPDRHPLFDVSFDYHNIDHHELQVGGLVACQIDTTPLAAGMDLVITGAETSDGIRFFLDYAADLFAPQTIEALAQHFDAFLEHACATPSTPLGTISLYTDAERDTWQRRLSGALFTPIHDLIADQAKKQPDAIAIIDGAGETFTYAQLDASANAVAARLIKAGLQIGDPVALVTVRDASLLTAQLGICKAGGFYVPLDPTQPADRHASILEDINPQFALAPAGFPGTASIPTVIDLATCLHDEVIDFTGPQMTADNIVYAVYTSGSTGRPKGIPVKHRGLSNLFQDHLRRNIFTPGNVIISLADPTFDIFAFESLIPLASGATVHICPSGDHKDAFAIASRIGAYGVTHIQVPVSKMTALCGNRRFREQLPQLRVIVCGGEHFSENLLALLHASTNARVFNMYGPTETTVTTTVKELTPGEDVTIGAPIFGSSVLVVGESGMAQPIGAPGELCVAGQGLAAGYINRPEETHHAFTTIAELPGVPVYRTGDIGVMRPDGEILLKGRIDHQVKINGNRIELGEIEQTAMRADGISYAVALIEDGDIVCYFTADDSAINPAAAITAAINASLPRYMIPQRLHKVSDMPRLPNNKIDRAALIALRNQTLPESTEHIASPHTHILDVILGIWTKILGRQVSADDNFFDVGGTSFKLMLVNNDLSDQLGRDIPLVHLFEHPTPASLAAALGDSPAPTAATSGGMISLESLGGFSDWEAKEQEKEVEATTDRRIAVIGIAGTFPGAHSVAEHWNNRADGVVSISRFTREELLASGVDETTIDDPNYVPARGHIPADTFDSEFFLYSRHEAETMDPQLRLLHETSWHALEDAGYAPGTHHDDIALFVGSGTNFAWLMGLLHQNPDPMASFEAMTVNEKDFLATKVAYKLNLTGPAVTVQTACSTSLVAVHEAVACLRRGEADMALAGGVALNFPRAEGYIWHDGMIFSPDGVCRPFSDDASGTVGGQGCGLVVLKPLDKALLDEDHIYAVVAGTAINNDGDAKVGYTAPGVQGQERVIRSALADAAVSADDIGYVETHGTGTVLGDPIEYAALSQVYGHENPCALGAVKANIGHLDAAAGIAGFLGAVGVLHRQEIPPVANFTHLNEAIEPSGRLYIPTSVTSAAGVRKAAVSSFGIGGTNAHVILEQAPARTEPSDEGATVTLSISACTREALSQMQRTIESAVEDGLSLRDAAFTLAMGRAEFDHRAAAVTTHGSPLTWVEADSATLLGNASDRVSLTFPGVHGNDDVLSSAYLTELEQLLAQFDDNARSALRASMHTSSTDQAVHRIAQFLLRAALLTTVSPDCLTACPGEDRLLRIAIAHVSGRISMVEALAQLRTGDVTAPALSIPVNATELSGPITGEYLRNLMASAWVHGATVDRSLFHVGGRRTPLPGYAFAEQHLTSDVRLDQLSSSTPSHPAPKATDDQSGAEEILKELWAEVIGVTPEDNDDFLTSGGDSLTAIRLCTLIQERMGKTLTVKDIFATSQFKRLRDRLAGASPSSAKLSDCPVETALSGTFPASAAQRRIYAVCAIQGNTTAYNLAINYKITGEFDITQLRRACATLVARHDQLRTSFHLDGADLIQHVHKEVPDVVSQVLVSPQEAAVRLAAEPRPFDLSQAPLFRVEVLTVSDTEHYLQLDLHHIVGDQASLAVLTQDLINAWADHDLGVAPMPYPTCMAKIAELEASGALARDVAFFTTMLGDAPARLELPYDHTQPEEPTFVGDRITLESPVTKETLIRLASSCKATPYSVFLTAIGRVLNLFSGQSQFLIGTAVSGRTIPGAEGTVGMFVNTLPLDIDVSSDQSVRQAVTNTHDHIVEVLSHQNAPFEDVLTASGIPASGSAHPLFDVLISFVTVGTEELKIDGLTLEALPPGKLRSRYPLSFSIAEQNGQYSIDLDYQTELFDSTTIVTMARLLEQLLIEFPKDADRQLALVPLESGEERDRRRDVLTAGGSPITTALDVPLREAFARYADLPALRWEGEQWSYGEVDQITRSLAGGLQEAGIKPGDVVGTIIERGPWQVWSRIALAICGAVELPFDPKTPDKRIMQTLSDAQASVVLCSNPQEQRLPDGVSALQPADLSGAYEPPQGLTPESQLIMLYTSGTTGRPKGILVTHGGTLSTCIDTDYVHYQPGDRVLHLTGYTFDPSMFDVYGALLSGATIVMGSHAHNMDPYLLADLIRTEKVNKGVLITAVFHLLMAENPEAVAGMSALVVAGEAMQPWAAARAYEVFGPGRLFNLYGPTEASIFSTCFRVDEYPDFRRMPIGFPTNNRELFVINPDGMDMPRGVPGELCVAGPGLALGYHKRPELTAEKFPENLGNLGKRVYRTGDRVVLDEKYRLVFLDRVDRQVKHAGHRIELSEIEIVAQKHAEVTDAIVIHTVSEHNVSQLLGFYIGEAEPNDLRSHLNETLPAHMVPQQLVKVAKFPLNVNGKVDRKKLLAELEASAKLEAPTEQTAPAGVASPEILAAAREVLAHPALSPSTDFFTSGVQSIQAIALARRLRELGFTCQVSDIYRYPTVAQLTQVLTATASSSPATTTSTHAERTLDKSALDRLTANIVADSVDLAEAFSCEAPEYQFDASGLAHLHASGRAAIGGFIHRLSGIDTTTLCEAVSGMVFDHEVLRARSSTSGFDVVSAEALAELPVLLRTHDLRWMSAHQLTDLTNALAHGLAASPFDRGLLWRCAIIMESDTSARLVWIFHHSIFDGFSAQILRDELQSRIHGSSSPTAQRYSSFLSGLTEDQDWKDEIKQFDYSRWLSSNEAVKRALRNSPDLPSHSVMPLNGQNPLELGLHSVHSQLSEVSSESAVAVGIVSDCRQWRGKDYSSCLGEFLDAVPVMLNGNDDQPTVTQRLATARDRGLHYLHALSSEDSQQIPIVERLRSAYHSDDGKLGFTLVNFQGYISPTDRPSEDLPGPAMADTQVNLWYDDEAVHVQWLTDQPELTARTIS